MIDKLLKDADGRFGSVENARLQVWIAAFGAAFVRTYSGVLTNHPREKAEWAANDAVRAFDQIIGTTERV